MTSPSISLKTKSRIASADILADDLKAQWWELAGNRELDTVAGDGARGGVVLDENGQLRWEAVDKNDNQIAHVERKRDCGPFQIVQNKLRVHRPNDGGALRFGPPPQPQPDGFYCERPDHPLSINRRAYVGIELSDGRQVAFGAQRLPIQYARPLVGFPCEVCREQN